MLTYVKLLFCAASLLALRASAGGSSLVQCDEKSNADGSRLVACHQPQHPELAQLHPHAFYARGVYEPQKWHIVHLISTDQSLFSTAEDNNEGSGTLSALEWNSHRVLNVQPANDPADPEALLITTRHTLSPAMESIHAAVQQRKTSAASSSSRRVLLTTGRHASSGNIMTTISWWSKSKANLSGTATPTPTKFF